VQAEKEQSSIAWTLMTVKMGLVSANILMHVTIGRLDRQTFGRLKLKKMLAVKYLLCACSVLTVDDSANYILSVQDSSRRGFI
jgi:uncharacterized membrane protein